MAKEEQILSGTFTASDLGSLIKDLSESNKESFQQFAKELASRITHPEPTEQEVLQRQRALAERVEEAKMQDANREQKRKFCTHPASPHAPHRRTGAQWGMFNGSSVIAWQYTQATSKNPVTGRTQESQVFPVGVCMWCQTEFKPGDSNYEEALSWGINAVAGSSEMNVRTGQWING